MAGVFAREDIKELISVDLATVVLVEQHEGCLEVGLLEEGACIHAGSQEFRVVDRTSLIDVGSSEDLD